ncbi:glycoside hydrolase family 97 catalytic domain-containing protein [Halapricum salinum]|nr:glycoside hydrolase family 97 catalytic domain-containing protein [Halapricum salinum]
MCAREAERSPLRRRTFLGALAAAGGATLLPTAMATAPEEIGQQISHPDPITSGPTATTQTIQSPGGTLSVTLDADDGALSYRVERAGEPVIEDSELGLEFADGSTFGTDATVLGSATDSVDRTWEPPWGRYSEIRERYRELAVTVEDERTVTVTIRVFEEGVGLRYTIHGEDDFEIVDERTTFAVAGDGDAAWYNDDPNKYEQRIRETAISDVGGANTPITMALDDGPALSIHEADLTDYAAMRLAAVGGTTFESTLVTWPDGVTKVRGTAPHVSPWRTVEVGDGVGDLIESNLVVNLAQESKIEDPSWVEPGKYMGIWWELHIGESTWHPGDRVGATTENAKQYIDFCAAHDIPNLLAEGWNVGWDPGGLAGFDDQDFTRPTEHFDLQEILDYGGSRGVSFVAHNETGAQAARYDENMADIFAQYNEWGIPAVKNGYVNPPFHNGQKQQSQWAVKHYRRMVATAAQNEVMINAHEPIKPTGERRTWPNFMTREGVQGMEYQNFTGGLPANHSVLVAQTRMLAGPVDYTPGIFDLTDDGSNVNSTRARQLSHYPVLFSGLQMVADLPKNYRDDDGEVYPEFEFIADVPASWDETRVVDTELGSYVSIARKREGVWYVGTQSGESRSLDLALDFLDDEAYVAEIYADAPETSLGSNPEAVAVEERTVSGGETITVELARGGGHAMRLVPAEGDVPYCPSLSVDAPQRADVGTTTISGTTDADSVRVEVGDSVFEPAVEDGQFSAAVPITAGENSITVSVPKRNADERCRETAVIQGVDRLADWSDSTGDDHGPGSYTYPGNHVFTAGSFDLTRVTIDRVGASYEIGVSIGGTLENPWQFEGGFSTQFLQVYVRDPARSGGTTDARAGVDAAFEAPYHRRILANGEHGVTVEAPDGEEIATGSTRVDTETIVLTVPADAVGPLSTSALAVLVLGYDGHTESNVRPVESEASTWRFGGAGSEDAPNVIDLMTPDGTSNAEALAHTDDQPATIPYRTVGDATVEDGPIVGTNAPQDIDGDGHFEDIDGDGKATISDVFTYFERRDGDRIRSAPPQFDFDGDGQSGTAGDVFALYRELFDF